MPDENTSPALRKSKKGENSSNATAKLGGSMSSDIPSPPNPTQYYPDEIVLYGIQLNHRNDYGHVVLGDKNLLSLQVKNLDESVVPRSVVSIAVIYSYSFEGGCYRFDRPKIMIFKGTSEPATGCGYDTSGYRMWKIDMKKEIMELETSFDIAEKLVLDANLPGNRAHNTYGNNMQLAHRGNRIKP